MTWMTFKRHSFSADVSLRKIISACIYILSKFSSWIVWLDPYLFIIILRHPVNTLFISLYSFKSLIITSYVYVHLYKTIFILVVMSWLRHNYLETFWLLPLKLFRGRLLRFLPTLQSFVFAYREPWFEKVGYRMLRVVHVFEVWPCCRSCLPWQLKHLVLSEKTFPPRHLYFCQSLIFLLATLKRTHWRHSTLTVPAINSVIRLTISFGPRGATIVMNSWPQVSY